MASHMARDGRRRRVLNEEVRTASGLNVARMSEAIDYDAPRYGEQASIENHPQITDYIPRRKRAVILTLSAGVSAAAAAQAAVHFAEPISQFVSGISAESVTVRSQAMIAWSSAVALLLCAAIGRLMFNLRRHRVDDYAGRYRVWRWITWGGVAASMNAVVGVQDLISDVAIAVTGKQFTSAGVEWWLAPAALVGGWIGLKLVLEVRECRGSLAMVLLAAGCYVVAAVGALGLAPESLATWGDPLTVVVPLVGHTFALAGLMIFGRYVVLDVQGLIEHRPAARPTATKAEASQAANAARNTAEAKPIKGKVVEGDEQEEEDDDEAPATHKLSKLERKRLRREQRAA